MTARPVFEPWEAAQEVIDEITDAVLDEWTADPSRVSEAGASLADDEYRAIDLAHAMRDAARLFAVRDAAVRRAMRADAKKEANRRLDRMARERKL